MIEAGACNDVWTMRAEGASSSCARQLAKGGYHRHCAPMPENRTRVYSLRAALGACLEMSQYA
ncbi:hypothetical protein [Neoasaia chiangmaiensis]|uniref:Uncharacterized protein n=1 Tax=Neoasaia chiangmaiensis TaxID=320497 RepID=A0A1U9KRF3_9PROT|nr:hypothetical protein [Neoasaia chiangmaiensis]AQS88441.1 hypothetical protein A0U93_11405 [Neoasaia chiangmaiensis]